MPKDGSDLLRARAVASEPRRGDTPEPEPLAVDLRGAARLLSLSPRTTWNLARRGLLPSFKINRRRLFAVNDLRRWVADRAQRAGGGGA